MTASVHQLDGMVKGWFVGDFEPTALRTNAAEVAVKEYAAGDHEELHHHRIATEVTTVVRGEIEMLGRSFSAGDVVVIPPNTATAFRAVTDAVTVVVKVPGAHDDKYLGEAPC